MVSSWASAVSDPNPTTWSSLGNAPRKPFASGLSPVNAGGFAMFVFAVVAVAVPMNTRSGTRGMLAVDCAAASSSSPPAVCSASCG